MGDDADRPGASAGQPPAYWKTMIEPYPASRTTPSRARPAVTRWQAAVSGAVAAALALATGELVAAFVPGATSPIVAVGEAIIDLAPPGSKDFVVSLFGTNDKLALLLVVGGAVLVFGALIGLLARRSTTAAGVAIVVLTGVGTLAALRDPASSMPAVLASWAAQAGAGYVALTTLLGAARPAAAGRESAGPSSAGEASAGRPTTADRRRFLAWAGGLGALAVLGGGLGRSILNTRAASQAEANTAIPPATSPVPSVGPDDAFSIDGITPLVMPNDQFYRIDTALLVPSVDLASWQLRVHGMVNREVTLTFDQLVALPLVEQYVTIACVSNEVGGDLVGNAKWTGVPLMDVLDMAGIQDGATQIVPRSVDGWTAGFPTDWVTHPERPRTALIAVKMNDEPLPVEHGFPARLIVPGLYGYVSATKWLAELELTTLDAFDAYWVPRGWAKEAPILTQSRIDVPRNGSSVAAGPVTVAGVAWAPDRGVTKVEIQVDGGDWRAATLSTAAFGPQTWVQWRYAWQAPPGQHTIAVRATDGTGAVQDSRVTPPPPDGARGYHSITVDVG
jgi:DMSO/TMAO reductase YedYZ molybdopterin-dependent catalytic subunit